MQTTPGQRFGSFLILVGFGILMVFITYEIGGLTHFDYLLVSLLLIILGARLKMHGKTDSKSNRFKSVRILGEKFRPKNDQELTNNDLEENT